MHTSCKHTQPRFTLGKNMPRTSNEIETIHHIIPVPTLDTVDGKTLEKLADIFESRVLRLPETSNAEPRSAKSLSYKTISSVEDLPDPPKTRTKLEGIPIDLETAKVLRRALFGDATHTFTKDWSNYRFHFRDSLSAISYGLKADSAGARALTLCVQAYVLKYLIFDVNDEEEELFGRAAPVPTASEQKKALTDAICDILWKLAKVEEDPDKRHVVITLPGDSPCFKTLGYLLTDGLIERLWLFTVSTKNELQNFVEKNLRFFCNEGQPGGILLLYSIILSHTAESIFSELANCQRSLMTETSRPTQAFINLLLYGHATCHVHNGVIRYDKHGRDLEVPKPGPRSRSEIGFLYFDKEEDSDKRTMVGCMLRTPLLPIWLTQVNGSYGLIFCTSKGLVADWKTERFFTVHYYTGHFSQTNPTSITVDTRIRAYMDPSREISYWDDEEEKERKQPSLELLLDTKWPDAVLNWNGETPYY